METKEFETKVIDIIQRTHDIKSFRFAVSEDINFKPGQFFVVTIKINNKETSKHFSFSNSPTEKGYIEFTKKITSSEFSRALDNLKEGDWARLKLPYGAFTFEGEYSKVAFLSGGIGITPIRSICKFACDKKLPSDIILIYGNNTENDIPFLEDFSQMQADNYRLKVVYVIASPLDKDAWKGRTGFINIATIKEEIPDYKERVFYICGPPKMVEALESIISEDLGLDKEKVKLENFSGYD
jgi:ferredoxin-NADP reductase